MSKKTEEKSDKNKETKKISQAEFEKKVMELAEKGLTSEKIGETLKREGIHPKEFGKKISKILGSKYINPDIKNIQDKLEKLKEHSKTNKKDKRAMRDKERTFSKLRRIKKYFKQL